MKMRLLLLSAQYVLPEGGPHREQDKKHDQDKGVGNYCERGFHLSTTKKYPARTIKVMTHPTTRTTRTKVSDISGGSIGRDANRVNKGFTL